MEFESQQSTIVTFGQNTLFGFASTVLTKICMLPIDIYQNLRMEMYKAKMDISSFKNNILEMRSIVLKNEFPLIRNFFLSSLIASYKAQTLNLGFCYTLFKIFDITTYRNDQSYSSFVMKSISSGILAGAATLSLTYPFDIGKMHYFKQPRENKQTYSAIMKQIIQKEGLLSLYKGVTLSIAGVSVYRGMYFGLYNSIKPIIPPAFKVDRWFHFLAAISSTFVAMITSVPFDYLRKIAMIQSQKLNRQVGGYEAFLIYSKSKQIPSFPSMPFIPRLLTGSGYLILFDVVSNYIKTDISIIQELKEEQE